MKSLARSEPRSGERTSTASNEMCLIHSHRPTDGSIHANLLSPLRGSTRLPRAGIPGLTPEATFFRRSAALDASGIGSRSAPARLDLCNESPRFNPTAPSDHANPHSVAVHVTEKCPNSSATRVAIGGRSGRRSTGGRLFPHAGRGRANEAVINPGPSAPLLQEARTSHFGDRLRPSPLEVEVRVKSNLTRN